MRNNTQIDLTPTNKPKIISVRPDAVTVDPRVQRPLDPRRVATLVRDFRPEALGVPTVSIREAGDTEQIITLDGQTRIAALRELGLGAKPIQVNAYRCLTIEQEAELFRLLNASKRLSPVDLFRIALTEGDPIAKGADKFLQLYGWTSLGGRTNSCSAVSTLYNAYEADDLALKRALEVLSRAWGPTRQAAQASLLQGSFIWMRRYADPFGVNIDRLAAILAKEPGGPDSYIGRAKGNAKIRGISIPDSVADLVTNNYNYRPGKTKTVPTWQTA